MVDGALEPATCNKFIEIFAGCPEVAADPQPDYSLRRYVFASAEPAFRQALLGLFPRVEGLVEGYFHHIGAGCEDWADDGFVMAQYRPGDDCALHLDGQTCEPGRNGLRLLTLLFYLNDADGGETYFPNQDVAISPREGRAVLFPVQLTHPHGVKPAASDRYILQTWITEAGLQVTPEE